MLSPLKGALVYGQSGGPTAVINNSFLGIIEEAAKHAEITGVYGTHHGIVGIIEDELFDILLEDPSEVKLLKTTPSAIFGSARYKLAKPEEDLTDYEKILATFKKHNIRYFFYNGGNDSMDTCNKVSRYLKSVGYKCQVIGVPKTIDNDLAGTDYCPGYGSAAKYISTSCMEVFIDCSVYDRGSVVIMEIMGRNAGWLAASAALANVPNARIKPVVDLVYLPEVPFNIEQFVKDLNEILTRKRNVVVAVSEGIKDDKGRYLLDYLESGIMLNAGPEGAAKMTAAEALLSKDMFNHKQLGGVGAYIASLVKSRIKAKVRAIELSLLQRCASHIGSKFDAEIAYTAGQFAIQSAIEGKSGYMVTFKREEDNTYTPGLSLLEAAANAERKVPRSYINKEGNNLTQEFIDYALPLIQGENMPPFENGLPRFSNIKRFRA